MPQVRTSRERRNRGPSGPADCKWSRDLANLGMSCNLNTCSSPSAHRSRVCQIGTEAIPTRRAAAAGAPEWTDDSDAVMCFDCQKQFTLFRRKHHCRSVSFCPTILNFKYLRKMITGTVERFSVKVAFLQNFDNEWI